MQAFIARLKPKSVLLMAVVNAAAYFFMMCVNVAADTIPINGTTNSEISQFYFNLLTPAPYTFVIWGFIYMLLGQFCIYCFGVFSKSGSHKKYVLGIGFLFAVSSILNALWLILWHYKQITAAFIVILLLSANLLWIFAVINRLGCAERIDRLLVRAPFGLYLGWLLTAAAVNGAALYAHMSRAEAYAQDWNICVMLILVVILSVLLFVFSSFEAAAAGIWSFSGILIRHVALFSLDYPKIVVFCLFAITFLFVSCVIKYIKTHKPKKI